MNVRLTSCLVTLSVLAGLSACSEEKKQQAGEPTPFEIYQSQQRIQGKNRPISSVQPSPPVSTGNNDHDFLRSISDHEKNVIVLSDAALDWNQRPEIEDLIRRMEERHGHDLDTTTSLLRNAFDDRYVSQPTSEMRSTADALRHHESDHPRLFLTAALKAEQDASGVIDTYLPKIKRPDVRHLAQSLKAAEITNIAATKKGLADIDKR